MRQDTNKIIADIKNALQLPKTTLELWRELRTGQRKRMPPEFIEDALKSLDRAVRLLDILAGWK